MRGDTPCKRRQRDGCAGPHWGGEGAPGAVAGWPADQPAGRRQWRSTASAARCTAVSFCAPAPRTPCAIAARQASSRLPLRGPRPSRLACGPSRGSALRGASPRPSCWALARRPLAGACSLQASVEDLPHGVKVMISCPPGDGRRSSATPEHVAICGNGISAPVSGSRGGAFGPLDRARTSVALGSIVRARSVSGVSGQLVDHHEAAAFLWVAQVHAPEGPSSVRALRLLRSPAESSTSAGWCCF